MKKFPAENFGAAWIPVGLKWVYSSVCSCGDVEPLLSGRNLLESRKTRLQSDHYRPESIFIVSDYRRIILAVFCWHEVVCSCRFFFLFLQLQFVPPPGSACRGGRGFQVADSAGLWRCLFCAVVFGFIHSRCSVSSKADGVLCSISYNTHNSSCSPFYTAGSRLRLVLLYQSYEGVVVVPPQSRQRR